MHEGVKQDEFLITQSVREQMAARFAALSGRGLVKGGRGLAWNYGGWLDDVTGPLAPDTYKHTHDPRALLKARLNHQLQEAN